MVERRATQGAIEFRVDSEGAAPAITGYAAVFYRDNDPSTQYQLWPGAFERVTRGAFDESLKRGDDVRALFNHDPNLVLGRAKAGTLSLSVDDVGLRYTVTPSDTSLYRDLVKSIARGDIDGSSFAFSIVGEDVWYRDDSGTEIREIRSAKLFDVSPVTYPAYQAATSEARSSRDRWAISIEDIENEKINREKQLREIQLRH